MSHPPRPYLAIAAGWLATLVALYLWVLTPDSADPSFRWLWGAGLSLLPPAVACSLAAAAPGAVVRQSLWLAAQGMMVLSGGLGLLLLLTGAALGGLQGSDSGRVLAPYGGALALLTVSLYLFWFHLRMRTSGGST